MIVSSSPSSPYPPPQIQGEGQGASSLSAFLSFSRMPPLESFSSILHCCEYLTLLCNISLLLAKSNLDECYMFLDYTKIRPKTVTRITTIKLPSTCPSFSCQWIIFLITMKHIAGTVSSVVFSPRFTSLDLCSIFSYLYLPECFY